MTRRLNRIARLLALPALLTTGLLSAPGVSAGNPCFHGYMMPPNTTGPGTDIKLMPCAFQPTVTVVAEGTAVNFINGPDFTHLVTGAGQEWGSPDVEVQPNQTITYTFDAAGIYPYACVLHPGMSGAIVVGDLEDALAAGTTQTTTAGGSTGATTNRGEGASTAESSIVGSDAANITAESSTADSTSVATMALVGLGTGAGLIAGAAAVWLTLRRRWPARSAEFRSDSAA